MHHTCEKICPYDRNGRRIEAEQMPPANQPQKRSPQLLGWAKWDEIFTTMFVITNQ